MNPQEYLQQSERTNPPVIPGWPHSETTIAEENPTYLTSKHQAELLHAGMGMVTEAGEYMDQMKRHMIYGAPLDHTNLKEELGDMLWYIALAMRALDTNFEKEFLRNIVKLKARFPDKFTMENAINRDLDGERKILDSHD